jgi:indole-3-glycerol phosphate synthase
LANDQSLLVSESGLYTNDDLQRMSQAGINCFLVGESLMRQENLTLAVQNLLGSSKAEQMSDA